MKPASHPIVLLLKWTFSPIGDVQKPPVRFRIILRGLMAPIVETVVEDTLGDDRWQDHKPGPNRIDPSILIACALRRLALRLLEEADVIAGTGEDGGPDDQFVDECWWELGEKRTTIALGDFKAEDL